MHTYELEFFHYYLVDYCVYIEQWLMDHQFGMQLVVMCVQEDAIHPWNSWQSSLCFQLDCFSHTLQQMVYSRHTNEYTPGNISLVQQNSKRMMKTLLYSYCYTPKFDLTSYRRWQYYQSHKTTCNKTTIKQ